MIVIFKNRVVVDHDLSRGLWSARRDRLGGAKVHSTKNDDLGGDFVPLRRSPLERWLLQSANRDLFCQIDGVLNVTTL